MLMETNKKLSWNVYHYDFNGKVVEPYDIFKHYGFLRDFEKLRKKSKALSFEEFSEQLRKILMYHFWSRCEYEIIISSWPPREGIDTKIDIYQQVMLNKDVFFNYVWQYILSRRRKQHVNSG